MTKRQILHNFKQILIIFVASLSTAVAIDLLLLPCNVVSGGALGIASILDILLTGTRPDKWYMSVGVWHIAINIPIIIYTFVAFRKRFAFKTMLYVILLSVMLVVFRVCNLSEVFKKVMVSEGDDIDKVLYVVLGGALHGVSLPLMLSVNASTGGSDIVGLAVQRRSKKSGSDAMRVILLTNICILLVSAIVFFAVNSGSNPEAGKEAIDMVVYSVASTFICEIVQETIFKGFSAAIELEITTSKPAEMNEALQRELKHGTTTIKVIGGYSHQEKDMVLCIINKRQLTKARRIIHQVDSEAFAYVENVREVIGFGFANKELENNEEIIAEENT